MTTGCRRNFKFKNLAISKDIENGRGGVAILTSRSIPEKKISLDNYNTPPPFQTIFLELKSFFLFNSLLMVDVLGQLFSDFNTKPVLCIDDLNSQHPL